jgi:hypothetical protein
VHQKLPQARILPDLLEISFVHCLTRIIRHRWTRPPGRLDPDARDQSCTVASVVSRPGQGVAAQLTRSPNVPHVPSTARDRAPLTRSMCRRALLRTQSAIDRAGADAANAVEVPSGTL